MGESVGMVPGERIAVHAGTCIGRDVAVDPCHGLLTASLVLVLQDPCRTLRDVLREAQRTVKDGLRKDPFYLMHGADLECVVDLVDSAHYLGGHRLLDER